MSDIRNVNCRSSVGATLTLIPVGSIE